ncbi:hypothetical protein ATO6_06965 [Oceanicola sp. 22II-s10i]|nr:hypothetical protein ATO6_06965 [Oceanicola sp. 22II-s10i]
MAGTAIRKVRVLVAGSKLWGGATTRWMLRRIGRTSSISDRAKGEGRRLHPAVHLDHQRIADLLAQPRQRM